MGPYQADAEPPPPPTVEPPRSSRDLLLHTWAGRLFIISAALKLLVALVRPWADVPQLITVLSSAATIGLHCRRLLLHLAARPC